MQCSFQGCGGKHQSFGLCAAHREQQKAGKELRPLQVQYHGLSEYDRFLKRVVVNGPNDCWPWTGSVMKAGWHGQWRTSAGKIEPTHRGAWRLMKGDIPAGMSVLHKCDNPICCNPSHLFIGTQSDNARDMWDKGRAKPKTNVGSAHGMSKLTEDLVRDIRSSKESGVDIARRLGLSATTVCDIRKRRTWKHLS